MQYFVKLWLRDIKDDIKGPHLDFFGGAQQVFTRLCPDDTNQFGANNSCSPRGFH